MMGYHKLKSKVEVNIMNDAQSMVPFQFFRSIFSKEKNYLSKGKI